MKKCKIILLTLLLLIVSCNKKDPEKVAFKDIPRTATGLFDDTPVEKLAKYVDGDDYEKVLKYAKGLKDVDYRNPYTHNTLLQTAMTRGKLNSVKALLEAGADPNLQTLVKTGDRVFASESAFIKSCSKRDTALIKLFLKHGGDVNSISVIKSTSTKTPLIAASMRNLASVRMLIEAGADPHKIIPSGIGENNNYSALNSALQQSKDIDIINYLIFEQQVDFKQPYFYGKNIAWALRFLVYPIGSRRHKEKMKLVAFLKENGIDYYKEPIPSNYYNLFDEEYLSKY